MTTLEEALVNGHGRERQFHCPVHNDNNPSASVNIDKGVWYCYACGAKGKVGDQIIIPDDVRLTSALDLLKDDERSYPESWLDQFDSPSEYWLSRFLPETIQHFRLGYDHFRELPCYPLRDIQGRVLGVVYRNTDPESRRKYIYPYRVKISQHLFNASTDHHEVVVLTEGATDAMAAWEAGYYAVACYGRTLTDTQIAILRRISPTTVLIGYDQDRAGHRAAADAMADLGSVGIHAVRLLWSLDDGKDLASLTIDSREKIMEKGLAP